MAFRGVTDSPSTLYAPGLVNDGWTYIKDQADEFLDRSLLSLENIQVSIGNIQSPTITYTPPQIDVASFLRPVAPTAPALPTIDTAVPAAPALEDVELGTLPAAPVRPDFSGMAYTRPAAPNVALPQAPADTDVVLDPITVPDAPELVMPELPELYELNMPVIGDLAVPEFEGIRPTLQLTAPERTFNWQAQAYDATTINTIRTQLGNMAATGQALPLAIEQAIFERARNREDTLSQQQVAEASDALAARGLRQPAGLLFKALDRIRASARQQASTASRDIAIEQARMNVEAVRFAVAQGIALESTMLQNHLGMQGLLLDAAKAAQAVVIDLFNAEVALHNAQWEGFRAEAQVYESRIRALAAQVDLDRARIEAEKAKGDVNESLVRAYGERVRALGELVNWHRAQVEAARARGEINSQRLEQVRLRVQTYGEQVNGYGRVWDAYRAQTDAEANSLRYFETMGNVYAQDVQAWRGQVDAQGERARTAIAVQNQRLEHFRAVLAGLTTRVQAQLGDADARARIFSAQASMFAAEGQVSAAESAAADRTAELRLGVARLDFDGAARNAELLANFLLKRVDQAIAAGKDASEIQAQLAAALLSGMNFGASMSYGASDSISHNFSYDGNG
jgi:hypothetical protein